MLAMHMRIDCKEQRKDNRKKQTSPKSNLSVQCFVRAIFGRCIVAIFLAAAALIWSSKPPKESSKKELGYSVFLQDVSPFVFPSRSHSFAF